MGFILISSDFPLVDNVPGILLISFPPCHSPNLSLRPSARSDFTSVRHPKHPKASGKFMRSLTNHYPHPHSRAFSQNSLTETRQFIQSSYSPIKSARPDLKFMIREASGVEARAFVRFGKSYPLYHPLIPVLPGSVNLY